MFSLLSLLLLLTYFLVIGAVVTGLLKYIFPKNNIVKLLHSATGPLSNFLYGLYFISAQFDPKGYPIQRIILAVCLLLLIYTGIVTGKAEPKRNEKIAHNALGFLCLLAFTFITFSFVGSLKGLIISLFGIGG